MLAVNSGQSFREMWEWWPMEAINALAASYEKQGPQAVSKEAEEATVRSLAQQLQQQEGG
jgi:hypothetical protein